jgi:naphthalene 1,2-dioxygenase system ferredoxin subunit
LTDDVAWHAVPVALPEPGRLAPFELWGRKLLLCNAEGAPYVVENRCSHALVALEDGTLRGTVLECPVHGGRIDVRSGQPVAPPIRKPVRSFPVRHAGGRLEVGLPRI